MATKKKKTIKVEEMVQDINFRNKWSTCTKETRRGWNTIMENILHETGNYNGFYYLTKDDVKIDQDPGIDDNINIVDDSRINFIL